MKARNCISAKDYYWKWESRAQGFDQGDPISGVAFSTNPGISTLNPEPKKYRNSDTEKTAPHDLKIRGCWGAISGHRGRLLRLAFS